MLSVAGEQLTTKTTTAQCSNGCGSVYRTNANQSPVAFSATSNATQVSAIVGCVNEAREEMEPALVLGLSESEECFCRTNVSASTMGESDIERASPADFAARFHAPASSTSPPKLADLLSRGQELLDQQQEAEVHHSYANKSLAPTRESSLSLTLTHIDEPILVV